MAGLIVSCSRMLDEKGGVDFDDFAEDYSERIGEIISFSKKGHSYYLDAKVEVIEQLARGTVGELEGLRILDVGCGVGLLGRRLMERNAKVVGVDLGPLVLAVAKERCPGANLCRYDGASLPFRTSEFDVALAVCVLHHVPRDGRPTLLKEMARVVKPGGLLLVVEHNPWNPLTRMVVGRCEFDRDALLLSRRELAFRLRQMRLEVSRPYYFLLTPWSSRFWRFLEATLRSLPFGGQYAIFGRKA